MGFLSTPSARRATRHSLHPGPALHISIHALREEGDGYGHPAGGGAAIFLSTPSARRATNSKDQAETVFNISIHALREEGDGEGQNLHFYDNISIHALREEGDGLGYETNYER